MTRLVALDTSTWWGGVALLMREASGGGILLVAEAGLFVRDSHSIHLLTLLHGLLAEAGWVRSEVDAYAATRGPGSFTGIRVGLGTLRGLGLASARPCLGVGTLPAMAEAFGPAESERVPLLDAGRGEVYGARYDAASVPPAELVAPWVGPPERALENGGGVPVIFGPGAEACLGRLREGGYDRCARRAPTSIAAAAGRLALMRLEAGAVDGEGLAPLYVRPADAEIGRGRD